MRVARLKEHQNLFEERESASKEGGRVLAVLGHLKLSLEIRLQGETKGKWVGKRLTQKQIQSRTGGYTRVLF